ncbi:MAG TPA: response regulator [Herpetosiphonaceae bacterium]|nr:response regulator [Herpetosiphonaceae bacterium]
MCNKILVVDDEKSMRRLLNAILVEYGFEVDLAVNTREADSFLAGNAYSAVVVDYQMPEEDGIQWITRIQAAGFATPCILISGGAEDTLRQASRHIRLGALMCKPFDLTDFVEIVRRHMANCTCLQTAA